MMQTLAEQLLNLVFSSLSAMTGITTLSRGREDAFGADELPAINIRRSTVQFEQMTLAHAEMHLDFLLEIIVAGGETGADALHAKAHQWLAADPQISALSNNTLFCTATDGDGAECNSYRLAAQYNVRALVSLADLSQPA